jgi:hypothetical protein
LEVTMTIGGSAALTVPSLGDRHLEVGQDLEQVGLERLVGAVQFVDQQDRRGRRCRLQRLQQRAADQEALVEDVGREFARSPPCASARRISIIWRA